MTTQTDVRFEGGLLRIASAQEEKSLWRFFLCRIWSDTRLVAMRRRNETILVLAHPEAPVLRYAASDAGAIGQIRNQLLIFFADASGDISAGISTGVLRGLMARLYVGFLLLIGRLKHNAPAAKAIDTSSDDRFSFLEALSRKTAPIDAIANAFARSKGIGRQQSLSALPPPFDRPYSLPEFVAGPRKNRAVLFPHSAYYNFFYLAKALRKRGWDAVALCTEAPDSSNRRFYHGEDLTIYSEDPVAHRKKLADFFASNVDRFGIIHSYGVGALSLFAANQDGNSEFDSVPWDILEWKRRGALIGYTHSGCLDGVSQSTFRRWSPTMCANCVWEARADVCSDSRNLAWGRKINIVADLFCSETDPPLDYKGASNVFRAPLTFAIDPEIWHPDLVPPAHLKRDRASGEIVVYAALGNYITRSRDGRDVKGTGAIQRAVEQLQAEGIRIRLDFVHDVPSIDNRFVQVQADIIVDQLNYGRYGALAREGMMLGKPVVGRVNKDDDGRPATQCIVETPIVHADESSIADVLRDLALDPEKRAAIGQAGRAHAIKWWSADRLAERFEFVYDHLRLHGRLPNEKDVP
ncbi:MAG: hypothetical protein Q8922_14550 [Bacteroidota bacterium]|nr:hypothetical protein [Bacteroidota bacterium]